MSRYVYIVDDDFDVRSSIAFMLATEGIASETFPSGDVFLHCVADLAPGCILLDLRMPGLDGLQVLARLGHRGFRWPVIIMTGHGERSVAEEATTRGAVDFLEKPFDGDRLLESVGRALDRLDVDQIRMNLPDA